MGSLLNLLGQGVISAADFEQDAFSVVTKKIEDRRAVEKELRAIQNLPTLSLPRAEHDKLAANYYFALENYISKDQPKNRVPAELLRGQVFEKCHPERADGNFCLIFLPTSARGIELLERFTAAVFAATRQTITDKGYVDFLNAIVANQDFKGIVKNGRFSWKDFEEKIKRLPPQDRFNTARMLLKKALGFLTSRLMDALGEIRAELVFKGVYKTFHDELSFIEDAPKALLIVPDQFLEEERVGLMGKTQLEEELRRKSQELESTSAELSEEKTKISSLSREELEKKVGERTKALAQALADLKTGRSELEEAKTKYETFLEHIDEGIIGIDREWNVILWNEAAGTLSGWTKEETMGKPLRNFIKFIHEHDRTENIAFIEEAMLTNEPKKTKDDIILIARDEKEIAVSSSATPIADDKGKVTSAIVIFRDTSDEKQLQKTREEFASLATHELRTPIAAIKGHASLLLDATTGPLKDEQKEFVTRIKHSSERLLALVNGMLNVSRIELGRLAIEPQPTYVPDLADAVCEELSTQIKEKKMEIKKEYDPKLPSVSVDPELTHAIFQNLLSNSVKYTPEKGKITITIKTDKKDLLIKVADNGYGIPKKQQSKMFSKLFRADNVQTKNTEGTGLGMYIVKSIIDEAGGKIWFESEENKGTTFFITIPLSGMKKKEGAKGLS